MGEFLAISMWITLATVIPGLVTIAGIYLAMMTAYPQVCSTLPSINSNWLLSGIMISVMILTQALGILFEKIMIKLQVLGPESQEISIPKGIDPHGDENFTLERYNEYKGLYLLLAEMDEGDDSQGHLKRVIAQFFLTNNTIVSFAISLITLIILANINPTFVFDVRFKFYLVFLIAALIVSFLVVRIRFNVMTQCLWAVRRNRMKKPVATTKMRKLPYRTLD